MSSYIWNLTTNKKPKEIDEILEILIENRQIQNKDEFLNPLHPSDFLKTHPDFLNINDSIAKAVKLVKEAIKQDIPIIIHGDYDADGQTATAIMWRTINNDLNYKNVIPYIPSRFDEGYGLTNDSLSGIVQKLSEKKLLDKTKTLGLIITVDCGIVSLKETQKAKEMGFKIIITDHHQSQEELPKADITIHSTKATGAGIAWALSNALIENTSHKNKYLDLASIGTICDLQPLTDYNRSIAKFGIEQINKNPLMGIKALIQVSGTNETNIDTYNIGWQIGPRLNATGRLESAMDSLRLLCTDSHENALDIASQLNQLNLLRQEKTQSDLAFALSQLDLQTQVNIDDEMASSKQNLQSTQNLPAVLITSHKDYHEGIIGLVAGKMVQTHHRASIAISIDEKNGLAKGSARSIKGISIIEELRKLDPNLYEGLGGHDMAAGFSIKTENLAEFSNQLTKLSEKWDKNLFTRQIQIDCELDTNLINEKTYEIIENLKPFGIGNSKPIFVTKSLEIFNISRFGKENKHIKIYLKDQSNKQLTAVGFSIPKHFEDLHLGQKINLAYEITLNTWNGEQKVELKISDIKESPNSREPLFETHEKVDIKEVSKLLKDSDLYSDTFVKSVTKGLKKSSVYEDKTTKKRSKTDNKTDI